MLAGKKSVKGSEQLGVPDVVVGKRAAVIVEAAKTDETRTISPFRESFKYIVEGFIAAVKLYQLTI